MVEVGAEQLRARICEAATKFGQRRFATTVEVLRETLRAILNEDNIGSDGIGQTRAALRLGRHEGSTRILFSLRGEVRATPRARSRRSRLSARRR